MASDQKTPDAMQVQHNAKDGASFTLSRDNDLRNACKLNGSKVPNIMMACSDCSWYIASGRRHIASDGRQLHPAEDNGSLYLQSASSRSLLAQWLCWRSACFADHLDSHCSQLACSSSQYARFATLAIDSLHSQWSRFTGVQHKGEYEHLVSIRLLTLGFVSLSGAIDFDTSTSPNGIV